MPGRFIRPGWAMGIIFGVFIGLVFLSFAAMSNPGFYREFTRPGAAQAVLTSAIRGIAAAILLTVLPFVIVWRAFGEESAGAIRKALIAAAAVVVVAAVSFLYSLGMPGAMQGDLQANFAKTMMAGAPTLISGSPLAAPISHVFLQLSEEAAKPGSAPIKSAEQSLNPSSGRFDSTAGGKY